MGANHSETSKPGEPAIDPDLEQDNEDGFTTIEPILGPKDLLNEDDWVITDQIEIPPEGVNFNTLTELLPSSSSEPPLSNSQTASEKKPSPSAHSSRIVLKEKIKYLLKIYDEGNNVEEKIGQRALAQLEATAASLYQLLSTNYQQIPLSTSVCYDQEKVVGVLSELFEEWIPYKKAFLNFDDLAIQVIHTKEEEEGQQNLKFLIENYIKNDLNRDTKQWEEQHPSTYWGSLLGSAKKLANGATTLVKNTANFYAPHTATAVQLAEQLKKYFNHKDQLSSQELEKLSTELTDRKKHILTLSINDKEKYQAEIESLDTLFKTIDQLKNLITAKTLETLTFDDIKQLEALHEAVNKQEINLDKKNDHERLNNLLPGSDISITVKSLKNYGMLKKLAAVLSTRYLFEDDDTHANNISKEGKQIDFDRSFIHFLTQFPELYGLKQNNPIQRALATLFGIRQPTKETFAITGDVIKTFPIPPATKSSNPFYSPAYPVSGQTPITMMASESASKNFYTAQDHAIFAALSKHPVFQFHVRKTFLKYLITPISFYEPFFDLHMDKDLQFAAQSGEIKNIRDALLDYEAKRIEESRKTLLTDPDFKQFIDAQGEFAFKLIEAEMSEFKTMLLERYETKLKNLQNNVLACEEELSQFALEYNTVNKKIPIDTSQCQIALEKLRAAEKNRDKAIQAKDKLAEIVKDIAKKIDTKTLSETFLQIKTEINIQIDEKDFTQLEESPPLVEQNNGEIKEIEKNLFRSESPGESPKSLYNSNPNWQPTLYGSKVPMTLQIKEIEKELYFLNQMGS